MNTSRWMILLLLVLFWAPGCGTPGAVSEADPVLTDPPAGKPVVGADPKINKRYFSDPDVESWKKRFEKESREIWKHREKILEHVALKPGMRVADIGTGTGFFGVMFAQAVGPEGKAYGVDIVPEFVENVGKLAKKYELPNLTGVLCSNKSAELPKASIDLAFICDVYHHFEHPIDSMSSIHRALADGGELVIIDFERIPGKSSDFIMGHVRAGKEVFVAEIVSCGFELVDEKKFLDENYFLRFRKTVGP